MPASVPVPAPAWPACGGYRVAEAARHELRDERQLGIGDGDASVRIDGEPAPIEHPEIAGKHTSVPWPDGGVNGPSYFSR